MEGLIGILFGIFFVLSSIINASRKMKSNEDGKEIDRRIEDLFSGQDEVIEDDKPYIPAYEEVPEEVTIDLREDIEENAPHIRVEDTKMGSDKRIKSKNNSRNKNLNKKEKEVSFETNNIFGENEIIRGVIFKEILDKPRARRPYRPNYW